MLHAVRATTIRFYRKCRACNVAQQNVAADAFPAQVKAFFLIKINLIYCLGVTNIAEKTKENRDGLDMLKEEIVKM